MYGRRQDFAWVVASARGVSVYGGGPGLVFPGKLKEKEVNISCTWSVNLAITTPSRIRKTFVARRVEKGSCRHSSHPTTYGPGLAVINGTYTLAEKQQVLPNDLHSCVQVG